MLKSCDTPKLIQLSEFGHQTHIFMPWKVKMIFSAYFLSRESKASMLLPTWPLR